MNVEIIFTIFRLYDEQISFCGFCAFLRLTIFDNFLNRFKKIFCDNIGFSF